MKVQSLESNPFSSVSVRLTVTDPILVNSCVQTPGRYAAEGGEGVNEKFIFKIFEMTTRLVSN